MTRSIISSTATYTKKQFIEDISKDTIQYNTIQYNTIQYNTIQYNAMQYNTIQYCTERTLEGATASIRGLDLDTLDIRFNLCVW